MQYSIINCSHHVVHYIPKIYSFYKWKFGDFPGGAVVENLPANAGDTGSIPGAGRSHMPRSNWVHVLQLLSLCATTTEARKPRARALQQEKPPQWEAHEPQQRSSSRLPQLEKAHTQQWRHKAAKK